jgi:hypothetical protein
MQPYQDLRWAVCLNCQQRTIWFREKLVAPVASTAPRANEDMPADVKRDFEEARDICDRSPRSAVALLRLCIHKLCIELGAPETGLSEAIGHLVVAGLPEQVQQAFDGIRIVGNSQLHLDDDGIEILNDPSAVQLLFMLVNLIVENRISLPKKTREFYESLPETSRKAVDARNEKLRLAKGKAATPTVAQLAQ